MKTEKDAEKHLPWEWCKKTVNVAMGPVYIIGAHWYDALCAYVSNEFSYFVAMAIMFTFLSSLSALLIAGHEWVEGKFGWDIMELGEFKGPEVQVPIPSWRIFKRFKRWMTRSRRTSFWLGNAIIGPPVITVLLRKDASWKQNLKYIVSGTIVSVVAWVSIWGGLGLFTWNQFVVPFFHQLTTRI